MDIKVKNSDTAPQDPKTKARISRFTKKQALFTVLALLVVVGAAGTVYFYQKYNDVKNNPAEAQQAQNTEETSRILAKLKTLIKIDETDAPTVARVEDAAKLKAANAEFYKNVEKGDYLVIFPTRAIIFRDSSNQIINIAPIISPTPQTQTEPNSTNNSSNTNSRR